MKRQMHEIKKGPHDCTVETSGRARFLASQTFDITILKSRSRKHLQRQALTHG